MPLGVTTIVRRVERYPITGRLNVRLVDLLYAWSKCSLEGGLKIANHIETNHPRLRPNKQGFDNADTADPALTIKATSFPKFAELPVELQLAIWEYAAMAPGRVVPLMVFENSGFVHCDPNMRYPALLHVCRKSREEALKVYIDISRTANRHPGGTGGPRGTSIFLNQHIDTICLQSAQMASDSLPSFGFPTLRKLDLSQVRFLALRFTIPNVKGAATSECIGSRDIMDRYKDWLFEVVNRNGLDSLQKVTLIFGESDELTGNPMAEVRDMEVFVRPSRNIEFRSKCRHVTHAVDDTFGLPRLGRSPRWLDRAFATRVPLVYRFEKDVCQKLESLTGDGSGDGRKRR